MTIVKFYQATDGTLHKTFDEYAKHEQSERLVAALNSANLNRSAVQDNYADAVKFISDNQDALLTILTKSAVGRRGRKPKSV